MLDACTYPAQFQLTAILYTHLPCSVHKLTANDIDFVTRVFNATTIETCFSFLPKEMLFHKMTREEWVAACVHLRPLPQWDRSACC